MNKLSDSTVRQISSGQVISEIYCVVKEVVENALDAGATRIEIALHNFGLDKIVITDDGTGISEEDCPNFARRHFTSKLNSFEDLASVSSYGFRGEGVASICAVADVQLITKTENDQVARSYIFNHAGEIVTTSYVAAKVGSTVQTSRLFSNLPVRRHQYRGLRRLQDSLTATEKLVLSYALSHPSVHFSLVHGMERVFSRPSCRDRQEAVRLVLGKQRAGSLCRFQMGKDEIGIEAFVPPTCFKDDKMLFSTTARLVFVLVNNRPVEMPEFNKLLRQLSRDVYQQSNRFPTSVWYVDMPIHLTDINLDPNKRRITFSNMSDVMEWISKEITRQLLEERKTSENIGDIMEADPMAWSMGRSGLIQPTEVMSHKIGTGHSKEKDSIITSIREALSNQENQFSDDMCSRPVVDSYQRQHDPEPTIQPSRCLKVSNDAPVVDLTQHRTDLHESVEPSDERIPPKLDVSAIPPKQSHVEPPDAPDSGGKQKVIFESVRQYLSTMSDTDETSVQSVPLAAKISCQNARRPSNSDVEFIFGSPSNANSERVDSPISSRTEIQNSHSESMKRVMRISQDSDDSFSTPPVKKVRKESSSSEQQRRAQRDNSSTENSSSIEVPVVLNKRHKEDVKFNMSDLRHRLSKHRNEKSSFGNVIGILKGYDSCLVKEDSDIVAYNNKRAIELWQENRLRRDCQLPSMRLDPPIKLQPNQFITEANIRVLESLKTREITDTRTSNKRLVVCEPALLWNGFRVQHLSDGDFELIRIPSAFEHSFEPVLSEILSHLVSPSPAASPMWRPHSVAMHFKNEAVRIARSESTDCMSAVQLEERFISELMCKVSDRSARQTCWHGKTAWQKVFSLPMNSSEQSEG